jgi:hypothetical protein
MSKLTRLLPKSKRHLQVSVLILIASTLILGAMNLNIVKAQMEQMEPSAILTVLTSTGGKTDPPAGNQIILVDYVYEVHVQLTASPDRGFEFLYWRISNATKTTTLYDNPATIAVGYPYSTSFGYRCTVQAVFQSIAPKITLSSPQNQTYNESSVPLVFSTDKISNWTAYSLDGKQNVTVTGNRTITELTNGLHNVLVYANDSLGNIGASQTINFAIAVPPKISILSPLNQTYTNSNVPLTFNVDKPATWLDYSIDQQLNTTLTGNTTISGLPLGEHNLTIYANDTYGNRVASKTIYFSIIQPFPTVNVAIISVITIIVVAAGLVYHKKHKRAAV